MLLRPLGTEKRGVHTPLLLDPPVVCIPRFLYADFAYVVTLLLTPWKKVFAITYSLVAGLRMLVDSRSLL